MRRVTKLRKRHWSWHMKVFLAFFLLVIAVIWVNDYINTEIRPTLMQLAEYEARAITVAAMNTAVEEALQESPYLCDGLYQITDAFLQMDATAANAIKTKLVQSVRAALDQMPPQVYAIPFGSLTGNSLLSGHGPRWTVEWKPEGYVQADWQEITQSLSINTTRYSAQLSVEVTINMVLDGRSETITVVDQIPLGSILLQGDIPDTYASVSD